MPNGKEINIPTRYTACYRNEEYFFTIANTDTVRCKRLYDYT